MRAPLIQVSAEPHAPQWRKLKDHLPLHWRRWAAGAGVMAACLVALGVGIILESRGNTRSIQLQALDTKGQLQIRWDPGSDLIRRAVEAKLYIIDGSQRLFVQLDGARLRRGAVSYSRQSDRVELRMTLAEPDGKSIDEQATFLGTRRPHAPEPQLEAAATPVFPPARPARAAAGAATPAEHRSRRSPVIGSGRDLPFTCSPGDIFHKTDAPAGWDTFACHGKNVWGIATNQTSEDRSANSAPTLTAKSAAPPAR